MADDKTTTTDSAPAKPTLGRPASLGLEIQVGDGQSSVLEMGPQGAEKGSNTHSVQNSTDGVSVEVGTLDGSVTTENGAPKVEASDGSAKTLGADGKEVVAGEVVADATKTAALPAFDAAKPEVLEAYTKQLMDAKVVGAPNVAALSALWVPEVKDGEVVGGAMPDGVYAFLESKGFPKNVVKEFEAGRVAVFKQGHEAVYTKAGSKADYTAAQVWARDGGFTDAQKAAYNADINSGDTTKRDNAVELLMTRFKTAVPKERRLAPQRTTGDAGQSQGTGGGDTGVTGYATQAEYSAALRKARETNDQAAYNETRKRLAASPWYNGPKV